MMIIVYEKARSERVLLKYVSVCTTQLCAIAQAFMHAAFMCWALIA